MMTHDQLMCARDRIHEALVNAQEQRSLRHDWIEYEREAVRKAAESVAIAAGLPVPTIDQLARCERSASGHIDYTAKFALYAARVTMGQGI